MSPELKGHSAYTRASPSAKMSQAARCRFVSRNGMPKEYAARASAASAGHLIRPVWPATFPRPLAHPVVRWSRNRMASTDPRPAYSGLPVMIWTSGPDRLLDFVNERWLDFSGHRLED